MKNAVVKVKPSAGRASLRRFESPLLSIMSSSRSLSLVKVVVIKAPSSGASGLLIKAHTTM